MNRVHDAGGSMQGMTVVLVGRWWAGAGGASPPPPAGGSSHQVQCSTLSEVSPSRSTPLRLSSTPHKPSSVQLPTSSKYSINSSKVLAIPGFVISHGFPLTDQPPMEITFNVLKPKEEFIKKNTTYTIHFIINNIKSSVSTQKSPTVNQTLPRILTLIFSFLTPKPKKTTFCLRFLFFRIRMV